MASRGPALPLDGRVTTSRCGPAARLRSGPVGNAAGGRGPQGRRRPSCSPPGSASIQPGRSRQTAARSRSLEAQALPAMGRGSSRPRGSLELLLLLLPLWRVPGAQVLLGEDMGGCNPRSR